MKETSKRVTKQLLESMLGVEHMVRLFDEQETELAKAKELLASVVLTLDSHDQILNKMAIQSFFDEYGSPQSDEVMQKTT